LNFVADEGVERQIIDAIRAAGHQVEAIAAVAPGSSDADVLDRAVESDRILLTLDKDFGALVYERRAAHAGVVLIRLSARPSEKARRVVEVLREHEAELPFSFSVIGDKGVRIRPRIE
jgi:predicted nuclease of predicted toxin-antitoxin system